MNIITRMQPPGVNTLPPELRTNFPGQGHHYGWDRLNRGGAQMQTHGGVVGIAGIGDDYDVSTDSCYSGDSVVPCGGTINAGGGSGGGGGSAYQDLAAIANIINVSSGAIAKTLALSNPGTMYRAPDGSVSYSQPTGNQQNLLIGASPGLNVTSPLGTLQAGGISTTMLMLGGLALVAFMFMGSRR